MPRNESTACDTLAQRMGESSHLSPLLRKAERLRGGGADLEEWLLKLAVTRGASHYRDLQSHSDRESFPEPKDFSNEELGVSLCSGQLRYDPKLVRAAGQLLSSPLIDSSKLLRLAAMERCQRVLWWIACACERVDKSAQPWAALRDSLSPCAPVPSGILPHWSRFVLQTGIGRDGRPHTLWLSRNE